MENFIIIAIIFAVVGAIAFYLYREKKHCKKGCIGCPYAKRCGGKNNK